MQAEAYAFEKHLGICSYKKSRKRYLLRMCKEGKTVYSRRNPYFVSKIQEVQSINLSKFNGRFVRVRGKIKKNKYPWKRREADLFLSSAYEKRLGGDQV